MIRRGLFFAFCAKGMFADALAALRTGYAALGDDEVVAALEPGTGYADALCRTAEMLADRARLRYSSPSDIAWLYVAAGETQEALEWFEVGFEQRDPDIPYIRVWFNESLRDEPRYQAIVRRLNFPSE